MRKKHSLLHCSLGSMLHCSLTIFACGKSEQDETKAKLTQLINTELTNIKTALGAKKDAKYACAAVMAYVEELKSPKSAESVAAKRLCGYDVPMSALRTATELAEQKRKAAAKDAIVSECFSADQSLAVDEIKKGEFAQDAEFQALLTRWKTACPE